MLNSPLVAENVGRRYRRNRPWAVRRASFVVPHGSITALVGPNGAGKSTIIRACLGFERPDEGRILVDGADPQRERSKAVSHVGYLPQSASLYRSLTVADHFDMARAARRSFDRQIARRRVNDAGISEQRRVSELSGGEQAQVALALAIGTRAPLLLLDEPMASLDPLARRDFLNVLVDDVRGRGATAVLSSHIVTDVEHACNRLMVLADGQVALDTSIAEAKREYRTLTAAELDGRAPVGTFAGTAGELLALLRGGSEGRPSTLEEIVLGHLASARLPREGGPPDA